MSTTKVSPVVLFGGADNKKFFDETFQPQVTQLYKYIMITDVGGSQLQMIIMPNDETDVEVLYLYMVKNNLNQIITNGGGNIKFEIHHLVIDLLGRSFRFDTTDHKEIDEFTKNVWPAYESRQHSAVPMPEDAGDIFSKGKLWTIEQLKKLLQV